MLRKKRSSCVAVQSAVRRRAAAHDRIRRHQLRTEAQCCVRLQSAVRRNAAERDLSRRRAARTVQALVRGAAGRRELARRASAASGIQAVWRANRCQAAFVTIIGAVVAMQAAIRRAHAVRELRFHRAACTRIQASARGFTERRARLIETAAAVCIQARWRCASANTQFASSLAAVIVVQTACRCVSAVRTFCNQRAACWCIQTHARRYVAVQEVRRRRATRCIQAITRGLTLRRLIGQRAMMATRVQAQWRGKCARLHRIVSITAATTLQSCARRTAASRRLRITLRACLRMQAGVRRHRAICMRTKRSASRTIQSLVRAGLARRRIALYRNAAVHLQAWWRSVNAQVFFASSLSAAIAIQTSSRRYLAFRYILAQHLYAVRVQSAARRRAAMALARRVRSARRIQATIRGHWDRQNLAFCTRAAAMVEKCWRARVCRRRYAVQLASAILLQAAIRMVNALRHLQYSRWAARHIQAVARGSRERRIADSWTMAAIVIQSKWRSAYCQSKFAFSLVAATIIQTRARASAARSRLLLAQNSVLLLQTAVRRQAALRLHLRHLAAQKIQALARGMIERRLCDRWTFAAVLIQAYHRGLSSRELLARCVQAARSIQIAARLFVGRRTVTRRGLAAVAMQKAARCVAARRLFHHLQVSAHAAIALQCAARLAKARKRAAAIRSISHLAALTKLHESAVFIQTMVRFHQYRLRRRQCSLIIGSRLLTMVWMRRRVRFVYTVMRLQSLARGRRTRSYAFKRRPELRFIFARLREAHRRMLENPSLCLGPRTNTALQTLLATRNLGQVLASLASLEMFTLISSRVAALMVAEGAIPVMLKLLRTCNRSLPHQKAVGHALRILANIGQTAPLLVKVWEQSDIVPTLVELAQSYRENEVLLRETLVVLHKLLVSGPDEWRVKVAADMPEYRKRLEAVHALSLRRVVKPLTQKEQRPPTNHSSGGKRQGASEPNCKQSLPQNVVKLGQLVSALASARPEISTAG